MGQHGNTRRALTIEQMSAMYLDGWTTPAIGEVAGVSGERVRSLIPVDVRAEAKRRKRERAAGALGDAIRRGLTSREIAEELGFSSHQVADAAIRRHGLRGEWAAAEPTRLARHNERHGPCRVCGGPLTSTQQRTTCGGFCHLVWTRIRWRLDPAEHAKHRRHVARWHWEHPESQVATHEWYEDVWTGRKTRFESQGRWFLDGSENLKMVVECVRRGYQPVIDALSEPEKRQVLTHLSREQAAA